MKAIKRGFFRSIGAPGVAFLALTAALVLAGPQAAWAKKDHTSANAVDPTSVTACGTLSGSNTIYQLANDLTESGTGTCITMTGSNSTLDLFGYNITGPGATSTGAGINITSAANEDVIEGFSGTISKFEYGILDQANNTVGDNVTLEDNLVGLELNGTSGSATEMWSNFSADSNTDEGVYFNHCTDECMATDFDASSTTAGPGVLITDSSGPRISVFTATDNATYGVHVGCTSGCGTNSDVRVGDAPIGTSTTPAVTGNKSDGIFLDASESTTHDEVFLIKASGNGVTSGYDLHDASSTCGDNQWVGNDWGTASADGVSSPACIPLVTF